jgi:hypothetical protein
MTIIVLVYCLQPGFHSRPVAVNSPWTEPSAIPSPFMAKGYLWITILPPPRVVAGSSVSALLI